MKELQFREVGVNFHNLKRFIIYEARTRMKNFWTRIGSCRLLNQSILYFEEQTSPNKAAAVPRNQKNEEQIPWRKWSQYLENQVEMETPSVAMSGTLSRHPEYPGVWCLWKEQFQLAWASHAGGLVLAGSGPGHPERHQPQPC